MSEFIDFLLRNWVLTTLFFCLLIGVFIYESRLQGFGSRIAASSLVQKMNHDEAIVYDIRSATAYQAGHISGAKSLTEEKLKKEIIDSLGSKKTNVLVCDNGQKSGSLVGQLKKQIKGCDLVLLAGGLNEWSRQNLPLKKGKK